MSYTLEQVRKFRILTKNDRREVRVHPTRRDLVLLVIMQPKGEPVIREGVRAVALG